MSALWTSAEIAASVAGQASSDFAATGVSIDSRSLESGDLFIALQGPTFDGHDFAAAALQHGASGALIHRRPANLPANAPVIEVIDTMKALEDLGRAARARTEAKVAAVTGSVGKTSTKEALRSVLSLFAPTFASAGNLNNQWGAPLSLSRMPRDTRYGVFELGMNHAGEISPLSQMVRPHVAIITAVEPVHIEFFASVEEIADAKAEIFDGLMPGGAAVLPFDNPHFDRLEAKARRMGARILTFGAKEGAWARLIDCQILPDGNEVTAEVGGKRLRYRMAAPGKHLALNSVAVLAAAFAFELDLDQALPGLTAVRALKGRGKREHLRIPGGDIELIDEGYNASPASVRAALNLLGTLPTAFGGRRIAVLGDMRELGAAAPQLHRDLAPDLTAAKVDLAFLVGPHMRGLYDLLPDTMKGAHRAASDEMVQPLIGALKAGDTVLIKGSLGTRMAPLVEAVRSLGSGAGERTGNGQ
ncbi:UDP-N-acetylmuramoylalanyl-D-glutamyl-2,6-diaminopimelate--D-alanyl-D-alanine ligase [Dongia deserti]|uniref:UDP-N-acetylmuramoylalanyl-D-glutamyl-2, 6-diaminopimelate--D-alanyl-D-alanine ligase n=1 Tax=Dongia deserti TaxID=2268030 RepID=UPI000E65CE95|nr:UDP-N-acetylmuramoylalanyl-D-glutamyl-2,6-diaminopimelate--D-alanyl-D-alanine ligase [Dongia deserti]